MDDQPLGEPKVEAGEFAQLLVRLNGTAAVAQARNLIALRRRQSRNLDLAFASRAVQSCHEKLPNEMRLSFGALKKDSFHNLRAPSASSAC